MFNIGIKKCLDEDASLVGYYTVQTGNVTHGSEDLGSRQLQGLGFIRRWTWLEQAPAKPLTTAKTT